MERGEGQIRNDCAEVVGLRRIRLFKLDLNRLGLFAIHCQFLDHTASFSFIRLRLGHGSWLLRYSL